jgi:GH24 family phage-related lysozyme (muramidase)
MDRAPQTPAAGQETRSGESGRRTHETAPVRKLQRAVGNLAFTRLLQVDRGPLPEAAGRAIVAAGDPPAASAHAGFAPLRFEGAVGNHAFQHYAQAKLIDADMQRSDPLEREADRFAAKVVQRSSAPAAKSKCGCEGSGSPCSKCAAASLATTAGAKPPSSLSAGIDSPGLPLPGEVRTRLEMQSGRDLSAVRVHTGTTASESADHANALAFTYGRDIVFGEGQYNPHTSEGLKLLAHEMTHVVQQDGAPQAIQRQPKSCAGPEPPPEEQEALVYDFRAVHAAPKEGAAAAKSFKFMDAQYENRQGKIASALAKIRTNIETLQAAGKKDWEAKVAKLERAIAPLQAMEDRWEQEGPTGLWTTALLAQIPRAESILRRALPQDGKAREICAPVVDASWHFDATVRMHHNAQDAFFTILQKKEVWDPSVGVRHSVKGSDTVQPTEVSPEALQKIKTGSGQTGGEGYKAQAYVALEGACTIGYGHVIRASEGHHCVPGPDGNKCVCTPAWSMSEKEASRLLNEDLKVMGKWIKKNVMVDLTQAQFDALVDIGAHVGHVPESLLRSIHDNMCDNPNAVRDEYLNTALYVKDHPEQGAKFANRRQERVWPAE